MHYLSVSRSICDSDAWKLFFCIVYLIKSLSLSLAICLWRISDLVFDFYHLRMTLESRDIAKYAPWIFLRVLPGSRRHFRVYVYIYTNWPREWKKLRCRWRTCSIHVFAKGTCLLARRCGSPAGRVSCSNGVRWGGALVRFIIQILMKLIPKCDYSIVTNVRLSQSIFVRVSFSEYLTLIKNKIRTFTVTRLWKRKFISLINIRKCKLIWGEKLR